MSASASAAVAMASTLVMVSPVYRKARLPRPPLRTGAAVHLFRCPAFSLNRGQASFPGLPGFFAFLAWKTWSVLISRGRVKRLRLLLYRLDRDRDGHVVAGRGLVFRHAEIRALDARRDFGSTGRLFGRRMNRTLEIGHRQRDRFGHTAYRQLAVGAHDAVSVELQAGRPEGDERKLADVEILLAFEHRLARRTARSHRGRVDRHIDRALSGGAVERHHTTRPAKTPALQRQAEMAYREGRGGVQGIDRVVVLAESGTGEHRQTHGHGKTGPHRLSSLATPLSVSFPAISYLSPPRSLIVVEAKCATGNFAVLNQSGLLISVSDSSLARSMLPRSMSNSAFDLARFFGRNTMFAFHLRNRPSTLTPNCLDTKRISLLSISRPCAPAWPAASKSAPK